MKYKRTKLLKFIDGLSAMLSCPGYPELNGQRPLVRCCRDNHLILSSCSSKNERVCSDKVSSVSRKRFCYYIENAGFEVTSLDWRGRVTAVCVNNPPYDLTIDNIPAGKGVGDFYLLTQERVGAPRSSRD